MTDHLIETFEAGTMTFTMNRPEARNAFSDEMLVALRAGLQRAWENPNIRLVVLTGAGGAFCAGGDVKGFAEAASAGDGGGSLGEGDRLLTVDQRVHGLRAMMEVSRLLHDMPKPTLAVLPGPAAGAGLSLALACDLRLAVAGAKITTAFANVGLSGDFGGSYFLTKLVGPAKARELYFSAAVLSAEEAAELGIVCQVFSEAEFEGGVRAYRQALANAPTAALAYMKTNLNLALSGSLVEVMDSEAIRMVRTFQTDDHRAAARAFVEKKIPVFHGR